MPGYIKLMKDCKTPESDMQTAVDGWAYVFLALKGYKYTGEYLIFVFVWFVV